MRYISFPREQVKHQVSYIKLDGEDEFRVNKNVDNNWNGNDLPVVVGQVDGRVSIWEIIWSAIFNNCFKNTFIYEFAIRVPDYYREQRKVIRKKYTEKIAIDGCTLIEEEHRELYKYWRKAWSLQDQILQKKITIQKT